MASSDPTASNQTGDAVSAQDESIVTPWEAGTNINYSKLVCFNNASACSLTLLGCFTSAIKTPIALVHCSRL